MSDSRVWLSGVALGLAMTAAGCHSSSPLREPQGSYGYPQATANYGGDSLAAAPKQRMSVDTEAAAGQPSPEPSTMDRAPSAAPTMQPGLGTTWGETRTSHISTSPFTRSDSSSPFATASLFYNDDEGARAMASASGFRRFSNGEVQIGGGVASINLKDESGRFLNGFEASSKKFLIGEPGERYTIVITNHVPARLEVVVSVDGLDVLDGNSAAFSKRGYLVEPHGTIEIDGFRQSMEAVAAFRFGSVRGSYASQKHGETRNVGVIGVALFNERGSSPASWTIGDTRGRLQADPFPGRFATPPR